MKPISKTTSNQIKKYLSDSISNRQTALKVGVSAGTVDKISKIWFPNGRITKRGRQKILTERNITFCIRKITLGQAENASQVQKILKRELDIDVVPRTVRNALKNN